MSDDEITPEPLPDGTFVETSFGRSDFNPEDEDSTDSRYSDKIRQILKKLNIGK